jgi:hypothetical protein
VLGAPRWCVVRQRGRRHWHGTKVEEAIGWAEERRGTGGELREVEPRADLAGAKLSMARCSSRRLEEGEGGEGTNKGSTVGEVRASRAKVLVVLAGLKEVGCVLSTRRALGGSALRFFRCSPWHHVA